MCNAIAHTAHEEADWEGSGPSGGEGDEADSVMEYSMDYRIKAGCVIICHAYCDEGGWDGWRGGRQFDPLMRIGLRS